MKMFVRAALLLAISAPCVAVAATSQAAGAGGRWLPDIVAPRYDCSDNATRRGFRLGRERAGREPELAIRTQVNTSGLLFSQLEEPLECLASYYASRAGRQQTWMDRGGGMAALGMIGAAASGGASLMTQAYWAIGGMTPVMANTINAYEPTRELYEFGANGVEILEYRYTELDAASASLTTQLSQLSASAAEMKAACASAKAATERVAGWASASTERNALAEDAERIAEACRVAARSHQRLTSISTDLGLQKARLPTFLARDVLDLNAAIVDRDRSIRSTPRQTMARIAASPFVAVGTALVGGDTSNPGLQEASALPGFTVPVREVVLAGPPIALTETALVSKTASGVLQSWKAQRETDLEAAKKAAVAARRPAPGADTLLQTVFDTQGELTAAARALNAYRDAAASAASTAGRVHALASGRGLRLQVDTTTRQGQIALVNAAGTPVEPAP